jgi:hypothetical protein
LLAHAAAAVKPGGPGDAVCTLTAGDGTGVAEAMGATHPDLFRTSPGRKAGGNRDPLAARMAGATAWRWRSAPALTPDERGHGRVTPRRGSGRIMVATARGVQRSRGGGPLRAARRIGLACGRRSASSSRAPFRIAGATVGTRLRGGPGDAGIVGTRLPLPDGDRFRGRTCRGAGPGARDGTRGDGDRPVPRRCDPDATGGDR